MYENIGAFFNIVVPPYARPEMGGACSYSILPCDLASFPGIAAHQGNKRRIFRGVGERRKNSDLSNVSEPNNSVSKWIFCNQAAQPT